MREAGNGGMTPEEYRTHFSLWAIAAAALIAGNDLRHMTAVTRSILLNKDVIAVDQDSLGEQGKLVAHQRIMDVWVRPLSGGAYAVAIVNSAETAAEYKPDWSALDLNGTLRARDLWSHSALGILSPDYSAHVPPHGVVMLKLTRASASRRAH